MLGPLDLGLGDSPSNNTQLFTWDKQAENAIYNLIIDDVVISQMA